MEVLILLHGASLFLLVPLLFSVLPLNCDGVKLFARTMVMSAKQIV